MKKTPQIRFRIDFADNSNLGPGKIALLEGISKCGSLSESARQMGISYRRAWLLIDSLNNSFSVPATVNVVGGRGGGGSEVTPFGLLLINRYREMERRLNTLALECLKEISGHVNRSAPAARRVPLSKKRQRPD